MGAFLMAVAMVALENDDRVLPQAKAIHCIDQLSDSFVLCGEKRGIKIARVGENFVMLKPFGVALIRIVRGINTQNLLH